MRLSIRSLRRSIITLSLLVALLIAGAMPTLAWFHNIILPSAPINENSSRLYRWYYWNDTGAGQYIVVRAEFRDGSGIKVHEQTYDFGWIYNGTGIGPIDKWYSYDCDSQGGNASLRLVITSQGGVFEQRGFTVSNTC